MHFQHHKLKKFSHTWWNVQVRENSTTIVERNKTLRSLKKYERMYPWGWSWRTRVVNNTDYQFVGCNLGVEIFLKKREHQKRVLWNRRLRLLCALCTGVSRKFNLHFTLMFYTKYLYKNWHLVSKITWRIWITSNKQSKVQKVEIWWARYYFCSRNTLYT